MLCIYHVSVKHGNFVCKVITFEIAIEIAQGDVVYGKISLLFGVVLLTCFEQVNPYQTDFST